MGICPIRSRPKNIHIKIILTLSAQYCVNDMYSLDSHILVLIGRQTCGKKKSQGEGGKDTGVK